MSHSFVESKRQEGDIIIFQKKIEEKFKPLGKHELEVPFESDSEITSIKVINNWNDGTGGYVEVLAGGVGHKFVKFLLTSQRNRGMSFDIEIWGRPPHHRHDGPPHHHHHHHHH